MARMIAYLNRGKDILLYKGVTCEVLAMAFPKCLLPDDEDLTESGEQDPYDNHVYNHA